VSIKKFTSVAIAAAMLAGCGTATSQGTPVEPTPEVEVTAEPETVADEWVVRSATEFVTEGDDYKLFSDAIAGDEKYSSLSLVDVLGTQLVNGTNHAYLAYGNADGADAGWYVVTVYKTLDETVAPTVTNVTAIDANDVKTITAENVVDKTEETKTEAVVEEKNETAEAPAADAKADAETKDEAVTVAAEDTKEETAEAKEEPVLVGGYTFAKTIRTASDIGDDVTTALGDYTDAKYSAAAVLANNADGNRFLVLCRELGEDDAVVGFSFVTVETKDGVSSVVSAEKMDFNNYLVPAVVEEAVETPVADAVAESVTVVEETTTTEATEGSATEEKKAE
jgi:hypothetical protein